jgi:hypothetical protein
MIEAWVDEENGEAFFCLGGQIDMHIKAGIVSKKIQKVMDIPTDNMKDAHRIFAEHLTAMAEETDEGWT